MLPAEVSGVVEPVEPVELLLEELFFSLVVVLEVSPAAPEPP
ncbi:MAG TPA: hypothetical protein VGF31_13945 [Myxococcaceae bacterium]